MEQIVQNIRSGEISVVPVPDPVARPGQVLIANAFSVISPGTEKIAIELARKSLLGKARERPDQVRRVLEKMRTEGFFTTLAQVRKKLDEPMTLGYSSAGVVLGCGPGVQGFQVGHRVASNGPHAGIVSVPKHLCALVPEGVSLEQSSLTVLGAIAMQGTRLARLTLGETAFVIGLGLIGQITVALLKASGCRVLGTDPDEARCELARKMGAREAHPEMGAKEVFSATRGLGADGVLITASTKSDGPIILAGDAVRKKGRVIAVGAVGLNLPRRAYYFKEAELVVSCSYGPGRYDEEYEEGGRDYPASHVRWTEQRNMQAVLDLMASGRLDLSALITHRFTLDRAEEAYTFLRVGGEPFLGIVLEYPDAGTLKRKRRLDLEAAPSEGPIGVGCLGAGTFARAVMLPAIAGIDAFRPRILCSPGGLTAAHGAGKHGFEAATTDEDEVYSDDHVQAVFVLSPHGEHARQALRAIEAGLHVFVEKPLALTSGEVASLGDALGSLQKRPIVMVGFNRRFSPAAKQVKEFFSEVHGPLTASIRFNPGALPPEDANQDESVGGGRIIGEACHGIDLLTYLVGSPPVRVFAESIGGPQAPKVTDDQCFITLRHANGSVSSVAYLAGGDRGFPKERVEVFGGGRIAVIEDFREVVTCDGGKTRRSKSLQQEKGHRAEVEAFARALTEGGAGPIPWEELRAVTLASIEAVRSLREGVPIDIS